MTKVRVESITVSLDSFAAGPHQSFETPMGVNGRELHQWAFPTRTFQRAIFGADSGTTGLDDQYATRGFDNLGAWILGRNMFAHSRGPWADDGWKGWWGDEPPYHVPVFVLTHYAREPLVMAGGTTFYFITTGVHDALAQARESANGKDVRIGGGANTIQQFLRAGLVDEMHYAVSPILLGSGERLFGDLDLRALGYHCVKTESSELATHVVLARR